jgi:CRP-like cAMP-binding protein
MEEPIAKVYFPETGMISLVLPTRDGEFAEASAIGRHGAAGLHAGLGLRCSVAQAVTQIGGRFAVISAVHLRIIVAANQNIRDLIGQYTEVLLAQTQYLAVCNSTHSGQERLSRWLLMCADITNNEHLPLTHEFLSHMLGVNRTTVTLIAQSLQIAGLIAYKRGKIEIVDREGLQKRACQCYEASRWDTLSRTMRPSL